MKKRNNNTTDIKNNYIKISHYVINEDKEFLCKTRGFDKFILITENEFVNIDYIISVSDIITKEECLRNPIYNSMDFKKIRIFSIKFVNGESLILPSSEFEKFKNIINYE